jgi:hypothetical protein
MLFGAKCLLKPLNGGKLGRVVAGKMPELFNLFARFGKGLLVGFVLVELVDDAIE